MCETQSPTCSSFPPLLCWKASQQVVCCQFSRGPFHFLKHAFVNSHERDSGAFQPRWWPNIKEIVCGEAIIKHNPVVSNTVLWLERTNTHTFLTTYTGNIRSSLPSSYGEPPHAFPSVIKKGKNVDFPVGLFMCGRGRHHPILHPEDPLNKNTSGATLRYPEIPSSCLTLTPSEDQPAFDATACLLCRFF